MFIVFLGNRTHTSLWEVVQEPQSHVLPASAHRFCGVHFCLPVPRHTIWVHFTDASAGHVFIPRSRARPAGGSQGAGMQAGRGAGRRGAECWPLGQGASLLGQLPRLPDYVNRTYREQSAAGFLKLLVPCTHETPNLPLDEPVNSICAFRHRKRAPRAGILLPQAQF